MKIKTQMLTVMLLLLCGCDSLQKNPHGVKLYTMDCGQVSISDMAPFADDGTLDGQSYELVVPCFLIRHAKGDLIWDTGWPIALAEHKDGIDSGAFNMKLKADLLQQLGTLGLTPKDIEYLSLSHFHSDHSGNANLFADATFIVNRAEHKTMFAGDFKPGTEPLKNFDKLATARTVKFDAMYDVFGDGTVTVHHMPGHTHGHSVLLIKPKKSQPVLLSGDLYIFKQGREKQLVPEFNADVGQTRRSMKKFEALAKAHNARVIVQHEPEHINALPKFPAYLE